jgi:serine/threonine protein kinase
LIVKCFGYFYDAESIYVIEEFLAGQTLNEIMAEIHEALNEQEVGSKICEILTAVTYLKSINVCHGSINQSSIINTINICKLKRPRIISQSKDFFFDIWCLGKLTFEMVTGCKLID